MFEVLEHLPYILDPYHILTRIFLFLEIVFIQENSADPDEMQFYVAFHMGLHCLPKNLLMGIQNEKG